MTGRERILSRIRFLVDFCFFSRMSVAVDQLALGPETFVIVKSHTQKNMQERDFGVGIPGRRFRTNKPCTQGGTARRIIPTHTWKRLMSIRVVMVSGCCLRSIFGLSAPSAPDCFKELPCSYASRGIVPTLPSRPDRRDQIDHYGMKNGIVSSIIATKRYSIVSG